MRRRNEACKRSPGLAVRYHCKTRYHRPVELLYACIPVSRSKSTLSGRDFFLCHPSTQLNSTRARFKWRSAPSAWRRPPRRRRRRSAKSPPPRRRRRRFVGQTCERRRVRPTLKRGGCDVERRARKRCFLDPNFRAVYDLARLNIIESCTSVDCIDLTSMTCRVDCSRGSITAYRDLPMRYTVGSVAVQLKTAVLRRVTITLVSFVVPRH